MSATNQDRAREALRLVEVDPRRSATLASAAAQAAHREGDHRTAAVAERARGLAALYLADLDTSAAHLRAAVASARRGGAPDLEAEARMTLAFVLNRRGRPRRALHEIATALAATHGVARARVVAQRGAILQQLGRLEEALADYRIALPALRRAEDHQWVRRVLTNRSVLHTFRHAYGPAIEDGLEADELCQRLGLGLAGAWVQENLGFAHMRRGDVPAALAHLDVAERRLRSLDATPASVLVDRGELLLSVRLVGEARRAAEQAVAEFARRRRGLALPEARLLLARAATLDGDSALALAEARRACREFTVQGRREWVPLARFAVLTARLAVEDPVRVSVRQLADVADALERAGWPTAAIDARLLAGRLAGDRASAADVGRRQLELAGRYRRRGTAVMRARAWYASALLRHADGRSHAATSAVRAGLRILDEHRATLAATDLRAHTAGLRTDLTDLALRIALADGDPRRVLTWAEHARARHLLDPPVRPPDDPRLAEHLAELRATATEIEHRRGRGLGAGPLVARQVALEREIRDYCRRQRAQAAVDPAQPLPVAELAGALGGAALVEFLQLDGALYAITLVDGRCQLHRLGPVEPIGQLIGHVPFSLRLLARAASPGGRPVERSAASRAVLEDTAERFDATLLRPLAGVLGDRPLVVVPTGSLQSLPWSLLPSCAGRPVTVAPSAALWYLAASRPPVATGEVVIAAGPGLPGARAEAEAVAEIHGRPALLGAEASVEKVTAALDGASLAHLATHGHVRADNPLFSSLVLVDGPLTVYDLERLDRGPHTVVLAACDSGRNVVRAGDELLGLTATFLTRDTRQLVASVVPVPDVQTAPLMVAFHRLLAGGADVATALATAQQQLPGDEPAALAAAAGFVCLGAGFGATPVG